VGTIDRVTRAGRDARQAWGLKPSTQQPHSAFMLPAAPGRPCLVSHLGSIIGRCRAP